MEKKRKNNIFIFITLALLFVICIFLIIENIQLKQQNLRLTPETQIVFGEQNTQNCDIAEVLYTISGQSMEPLIKDGSQIKVFDNYYTCNPQVARGDIIIYSSATTSGDIIKQIRALPGDIIKFENNNMFINGEILKNSIGEIYQFSQKEILLMSAYVQNGRLQDGAFFAFGDNITNSIDSRKMGGLGIANFKAKMILEK